MSKNNAIKGFLGHFINEIRRSFAIVLASICQQFWVREERAQLLKLDKHEQSQSLDLFSLQRTRLPRLVES